MNYGSVCSGIEAVTVAWASLGWKASFFSEISPFPRAVLQHHYPDTYLLKDFTNIRGHSLRRLKNYEPVDLIVGGTPCQSFSVAGLRKGMDDERGNLTLEYLKLARRLRPKWLVWENVPGVLSSNEGRDFGSFLGGLEELGYGYAYRTFNAQYFGVPQRRRRVFVVAYLGDWRPPLAVLFEQDSFRRHSKPSRRAGEGVAGTVKDSSGGDSEQRSVARMNEFGGYKLDDKASPIKARDAKGATDLIVTCYENHPQDSRMKECGDTAPTLKARAGTGGGNLPIISVNVRQDPDVSVDVTHPIGAKDRGPGIVLPINDKTTRCGGESGKGAGNGLGVGDDGDPCPTLTGGDRHAVFEGRRVRKLTPMECERLQGFPDLYTQIPWKKKGPEHCPDGHRYEALGNSMAVPVMKKIGERIQMVEDILKSVA